VLKHTNDLIPPKYLSTWIDLTRYNLPGLGKFYTLVHRAIGNARILHSARCNFTQILYPLQLY